MNLESARDLFANRVAAWLAEDVDAYMACWHHELEITMPSGVVRGIDSYRKLVESSFRWAAPVSFDVHHLAIDAAATDVTDSQCILADWTIRARRRDDDVVVEWKGLSVCEVRAGRISWWREHHLAPPSPVAQ